MRRPSTPTDLPPSARVTRGAEARSAAHARTRHALAVAGAIVALAVPALAAPPPCPGVRFVVDPPLVTGSSLPFDVVVVDAAGDVSIASGCPATRLRAGRRARWARCGDLRGVRLTLRTDDACATVEGTFATRGHKLRRFTASASVCGDGYLDATLGEACESDAHCAGDDTCGNCACGLDARAAGGKGGGKKRTTTTSTSTTSTSTTRPTTTSTSTTTSSSTVPTPTTRPPTTTSTSSTAPPTTTTTTTAAPTTTTLGGRLFEADNPWHQDVSALPKSGSSDTIIQALAAAGGWGFGSFRIDFSINVLEADASTPLRTFTRTSDFYSPDCDHVPVPVPAGGALEGETGYECTTDGDCHLIVVHRPTKTLYEMWRANIVGPTFYGGCLATWDLTRAYPATLRGDQCTSADAAGFPIAAMLFSADEVARGSIDHAIRFILPNSRMRAGVYVRPATHAGAPSGGANLPPYGVRFRLRADYPLHTLPSDGARVVARALQRYGMLLSDGGNIALTAQSDRFTTHKWSEVGVDTRSLSAIQVSDMEVVGLGTPVPLTYDCVRNP